MLRPLFFYQEDMIINQTESHDAQYLGDIQENRVGIDKSNIDFITTLLTSHLYSEPLSSYLRETVSNAYDSHVEAGTKDPILLLIEDVATPDKSKFRVSVRDYGVGVSPERFEKIYKNIGSSTKRESNDYIGMFGIGRFSCLSCADVANVNSYYEGVKHSYLMYKNGKGINIDKVSTTKGNFKNGLEVSVEIVMDRNYYAYKKWENAIYNLCLFENLHVEYRGDYYNLKNISANFNNRKILKYNTFCKCSLLGDYHHFFKVGRVLYPGDKTNIYAQGLIVDLPVGSVDITPNRENLQYTAFTNATIDKCIAATNEELKKIVNDTVSSNMTMSEFFKSFVINTDYHIKKGDIVLSIDRDDVKLNLDNSTIGNEKIPTNFQEFAISVKNCIVPREIVHKIVYPTNAYKRRYESWSLASLFSGNYILGIKKDRVTRNMTLEYFKEVLDNIGNRDIPAVVLIYEGLQALKGTVLSHAYITCKISRAECGECCDFLFRHLDGIKELDNNTVPQSFIADYYKNNTKKRSNDNTELVRNYYETGYSITQLRYLDKVGTVLYTANVKEDNDLRKFAQIFRQLPTIAGLITVKKESLASYENNKRFVKLEDFLYLGNPIMSKLVTAYIIKKNFEELVKNSGNPLIGIHTLPIYKEFNTKYHGEIHALNYNFDNRPFEIHVDYYKSKGWYNKSDVAYFTLNNDEKESLQEWYKLQSKKRLIIARMAMKKHGSIPKIGLTYKDIK